MKLCEFEQLNIPRKVDALFDEGIRLCSRQDEAYITLLYQIDSFYVEVYYHKKEKQIIDIRSCNTTDVLDVYIENIDINAFL